MTKKQRTRILELACQAKTAAPMTDSEVAELLALAGMPATSSPADAADKLLGDYHAERGVFASELQPSDTDEKPT